MGTKKWREDKKLKKATRMHYTRESVSHQNCKHYVTANVLLIKINKQVNKKMQQSNLNPNA